MMHLSLRGVRLVGAGTQFACTSVFLFGDLGNQGAQMIS